MSKRNMHCIISLVIGLLIVLCVRPTNSLTQQGVAVIGMIAAVLYLWLTVGTDWPSLLFMGLLIMSQTMTATDVWANSLGNFATITIIVFMLLSECLRENGVIDKLAIWAITRKAVQKRPYVFFAVFFGSNLIIGTFVENLSLAVIYISLAGVICEKIGVKKGDSFYSCMYMGILWCNTIVSIASPIAHAPVVLMMGMIERQLGLRITYAQWLSVGIPFLVIMLGVIMLCVRFWGIDTSKYETFDIEELKKEDAPLTLQAKISLSIFLGAIAVLLLPQIIDNAAPNMADYLNTIGTSVPAILAVTALCVIQVDGKPLMNCGEALKKVPLAALIFGGAVSVMSIPISSESTGITLWISNTLLPLIRNLPGTAIILILVTVAFLMTNFLSNVVTMILFFNIGVALLSHMDVNLLAFAIVITFSSGLAVLTPSASVPAPLFFGPGHISMKQVLRPNLLFLALSLLVMAIFLIPFASAIL